MSTPTSPLTAIPVITTEVHSSPDYSIDQADGVPVRYRIEERRRTIYVTTSEPSLQLSSQTLNELFKLADIPENDADKLNATFPRRTRSLEERISDNSHSHKDPYSRQDDPSSRPRRYLHKKNASIATPASFRDMTPTSPASSSRSSIRQSWMMVPPARILFYHKHDPHYGFTNFSAHPVIYKGKRYPTSEHLFQSFKFQDHRPNLAEHIRTCSELPSMAFSEARRFQPEVRKDWIAVNIEKMDKALWHKFTQHVDLKEELLGTGSAELVEDSDKDAFWGVGADGKGRNELGKALERLRAKLRNS